MARIKNRAELPDHDKPVADIIEDLGFRWEYDYDYPLPDTAERVQKRDEKHYAPPAMVTVLRDAQKRGEKIAAIVVSSDGHLIDGNTKTVAAQRNGFPTIHAFVVDRPWDGPAGATQDAIRQRMELLALRLNQHGLRMTREEVRKALEAVGPDSGYDLGRLAAHTGATLSMVQSVFAQMRARARLEKLGVSPNGTLTDSQLRVLGAVQLNDVPFKAFYRLVADAGLSPADMRAIARDAKEKRDDTAALRAIEQHREGRADQISEFRARGKSKPPYAAALRQRLGFILTHQDDPARLCEHNPRLVEEHVAMIERAVAVLQKIVRAHQESGQPV